MTVTAVILAGSRAGPTDPLAAEAGVPLKCFVPVAGKPMIDHVLEAVAGSDRIGEIRIVINDGAAHAARFSHLPFAERLIFTEARGNLADSVIAVSEEARFPLLVTTADNVHLTPASVNDFVDGSNGAGASVGFARKENVLSVHPEGQRKFYRFSDGSFSNCNIYWIGSRDALDAAEIFRSGGQFVKFPRRIIEAFGFVNLIRFRYGIGTVGRLFRSISRRFGFKVKMVELTDGAMAIDVDNHRSHAVAERILSERQAKSAAG